MTTLAVVLLVVASVIVIASLARGVARYRSVMRREWPKVPPDPGNDDDW